jgi:RAP1 GTPase activating protein 1
LNICYLDDNTGTHSVFSRLQGYEIMFHVAPMLPGRITDEQRLDRKRHLGNDIILIIFQEDPQSGAFQLSSIRSKQNRK